MAKSPKPKGPFLSLCASVMKILDGGALHEERLGKIEDRLASLDGGPSGIDVPRKAFDAVNAARRREGQPELSIKRP